VRVCLWGSLIYRLPLSTNYCGLFERGLIRFGCERQPDFQSGWQARKTKNAWYLWAPLYFARVGGGKQWQPNINLIKTTLRNIFN